MQHLSPPNVGFAQPFYAWLLFGKLLFVHLPILLLNFHIGRSIKNFDFFTTNIRAGLDVDQTCTSSFFVFLNLSCSIL